MPDRRSSLSALPYVVVAALMFTVSFSAREAEARSMGDCKQAWSKAVRSYLTTNRRAAPDGSTPQTMDAMEAAATQWMDAFSSACEIESSGDKPAARIEAAMLGTKILARLDPRGCARFLEFYMESTRPKDLCQAAASGAGNEALRTQLSSTLP